MLLVRSASAVSKCGSSTIRFKGFCVTNILVTDWLLCRQISAGIRYSFFSPSIVSSSTTMGMTSPPLLLNLM